MLRYIINFVYKLYIKLKLILSVKYSYKNNLIHREIMMNKSTRRRSQYWDHHRMQMKAAMQMKAK